ncbi:hypothetical protein GGX14DRAFT_609748 [Mycena pura]|uniref:Uncharacterized protein n=1 Tax=Mycena pura TaxID=153505 RepID=A0AAD6YFW9_9AGAR|nr:hypothetical protein GGX14DRAFT_609748 [Mycena pura]
MSELPRFHVNGEPILYARGVNGRGFQPVVLTNPDPRFPPRRRVQEEQYTAQAPTAIPRSEYPSRRLVAQATTLSSPAMDLMPLAPAFPPSHRPAPRKVALAGTARTGHRWPASTADGISRTDQLAPPMPDRPTDTWHNTSAMRCCPPAWPVTSNVPITITFNPTHGPSSVGVAFTELLYGRGVVDPNAGIQIGPFIQPVVHSLDHTVRLVLEWPGYHNKRAFPLDLKDDHGRYGTRGAFGKQIASAVYTFTEKFGDSDPFTPGGGRLRLGRTGIMFQQLRLLEVISFNGLEFYMRVGVVPSGRSAM